MSNLGQHANHGDQTAATPSRIFAFASARVALFDKSDCPNGPDEHGDYPCDPKVLLGGQEAECQACGRVAAWPKEAS